MLICVNGRTLTASMDYRTKDTRWFGRESVALTLEMGYAEAVTLFTDNVPWTRIDQILTDHEDGNTSVEMAEVDMSGYSISGPITDNRDGTVTIRMGKPLPEELIITTLAEIPKTHREAEVWRSTIETAMQSIEDDAAALAAAPLYPDWRWIRGQAVAAGFRFRHEGKLYKVIQAHTLQDNWIPGVGTESLYSCIDDAHAGTADDPIPYEGNMALACGLHYTQGGVVYRCTRDTISPVYNALIALVGLYVEAVV